MADILTPEDVLRQMPEGVDSMSDRFSGSLSAASDWINRACGRVWHTATYSAWHSGSAAYWLTVGERSFKGPYAIYLADPASRLATLPITNVSSVTENGTSLSVVHLNTATSFTNGDNVAIVDGSRGIIWRASVSSGVPEPVQWASGIANIRVAYTAGYQNTYGLLANIPIVPRDLIEAAAHVAALILKEAYRSGVAAQSEMMGSATYDRLLMPAHRDSINRHQVPLGPVTLAG